MIAIMILACTIGGDAASGRALAAAAARGSPREEVQVEAERTPEEPPSVAPSEAVLPSTLSERYTLGAPTTVGTLTAWPVLDLAPGTRGEVITLAQALAAKTATVSEVGGRGSVPALTLRNHGKLPILAVVGDIVIGGKQDRVVAATTVIEAGATVQIAVNCVEQGRWDAGAGGNGFGYGGRGEGDLVKTVQLAKNQVATWAKVAEVNEEKAARLRGAARAKLEPSSGTYRASLATEEVSAEAAPLVAALLPALQADARTTGLVAAVGSEIVSAEVFGDRAAWTDARGAVLRALALEALGNAAAGPPPGTDAATRFLHDALAGEEKLRAPAGAATRVETAGEAAASAKVVSKEGKLLHMSAFTE